MSKNKKSNKRFNSVKMTSPIIKPLSNSKDQTISLCLVMIVKDEEDTIKRCLTAVAPFIKYWVIVDTGSTDKTIDIINETMKELNIPGNCMKDLGLILKLIEQRA